MVRWLPTRKAVTPSERIENPHVKRLRDAIAAERGAAEADDIIGAYPLSKAPSAGERARWAEAICGELAARYGADGAARIREGCACGPSKDKMLKARAARRAGGVAGLIEHLNGHGAEAWLEGGEIHIAYPRCYCSFVNKLPMPAPSSWCDCSAGYTKRLLEFALEGPARVRVVESVQRGDRRCRMVAEIR